MNRRVDRWAVNAAADRAEQRSRGQYQTKREAAARRSASEAYERAVARSQGAALPPDPPERAPWEGPSLTEEPRKVVVATKARRVGVSAAQADAQIESLTKQIGTLADQAQALTRAGDHDAADALRAKAKKLAATRAEITKRNRK